MPAGCLTFALMTLHTLPFNPFQENTYVLADDTGQAVVIDPGMSDQSEREVFDGFLRKHDLTLAACWLTHAHIDHVLGLPHVAQRYGLTPRLHAGEQPVYLAGPQVAAKYGMPLAPLPEPLYDVVEGVPVSVGALTLQVILAPGHSPASVCYYHAASDTLIGGDVLFRDSIGRTDLPGGDHATLLRSIREQVYTLPEDTTVYPGHGPSTTVGYERLNNGFVRA